MVSAHESKFIKPPDDERLQGGSGTPEPWAGNCRTAAAGQRARRAAAPRASEQARPGGPAARAPHARGPLGERCTQVGVLVSAAGV